MARQYWQQKYLCHECGSLRDGNERANFCSCCGGVIGTTPVSVLYQTRLFRSPVVVEIKTQKPSCFQWKLAKILELECDGGDSPSAYLADAMVTAANQLANQMKADSFRQRAKAIDARYYAGLRKQRFIERLTLVLVTTSIMFGAVLMFERHEMRMALINQEVAVKW